MIKVSFYEKPKLSRRKRKAIEKHSTKKFYMTLFIMLLIFLIGIICASTPLNALI